MLNPPPKEFLLPPESIVLRLVQANRFNYAMATARSLNVDMSDLFAHLTTQCLKLSRTPGVVL
jgi:nuclear pore complex protein Nup160